MNDLFQRIIKIMAKRSKKEKGLQRGPNGTVHPLGFTFMDETRPLKASPLSSIIPEIFAKYGLGRQLALQRFMNVWLEIKNSELAVNLPQEALDRIRFVNLSRGTLLFEVENNALFQELTFYKASILRIFQQKFPTERIKAVKITVKTSGE